MLQAAIRTATSTRTRHAKQQQAAVGELGSIIRLTSHKLEKSSITIKSPQIIGWISELVPALPRLADTPQTITAATPTRAITGTVAPTVARPAPPAPEHTQHHAEGPGGEAHAAGA